MSHKRTELNAMCDWVEKAYLDSLESLENVDTVQTTTDSTFEFKHYIFDLSLGVRKKCSYE